jgi:hypothetical protein
MIALALASLAVLVQAHAIYELMLVTGDVTDSSARILYDFTLPSGRVDPNALVSLKVHVLPTTPTVHLSRFTVTKNLTLNQAPSILKVSGLASGMKHQVQFVDEANDKIFSSIFMTSSPTSSLEFLVGSCNRFLDDQDDSHLRQVALRKNAANPILMIHLGDQVYADRVFEEFNKNPSAWDHESLVQAYRQVYRDTWGSRIMQSILPYGSNIMLADDHEVINNLDKEMLGNLSVLIKAGVQVVMEYEYALITDSKEPENLWLLKRFPALDLDLVFLDVRIQRLVHFEESSPFLGTKQFHQVSDWINDAATNLMVFSANPLILVPKTLAIVGQHFDGDFMPTHPRHLNDSIKLVKMMIDHGNTSLFCGDVHFFGDSQVCDPKSSKCLRQFIASGLTKGSTIARATHLLIFDFISFWIWPSFASGWNPLEFQMNSVSLGQNFLDVSIQPDSIAILPVLSQEFQLLTNVFVLGKHFYSILGSLLIVTMIRKWFHKVP